MALLKRITPEKHERVKVTKFIRIDLSTDNTGDG